MKDPFEKPLSDAAAVMIDSQKRQLANKAADDEMSNVDIYNLCVLNKMSEPQTSEVEVVKSSTSPNTDSQKCLCETPSFVLTGVCGNCGGDIPDDKF